MILIFDTHLNEDSLDKSLLTIVLKPLDRKHNKNNTSEMSLNKMIEENEKEQSEVNKNVSLEG